MKYQRGIISALALAGLIGVGTASAVEVEFGGDVDVRGYATRDGGSNEVRSGFDQRVRLLSIIDAGDGVQLHARMNLFNDRFQGDASGEPGAGPDERPFTASNRGHRSVELDYGFLRVPTAIGVFQVGRQISNWNFDFTTSDARRDRLSYVTQVGEVTIAASYDRRAAPLGTARELDGNQFNLAFLGNPWQNARSGIVFAYEEAGGSGASRTAAETGEDAFILRGLLFASPWVQGTVGDTTYTVGGHYLGNTRTTLYSGDTYGGFVRLEHQVTPAFAIEGQVAANLRGGFVASGFDTFSSLIHGSPEHNRTRTQIGGPLFGGLNLSGSGTRAETDDQVLLAAVRGRYTQGNWEFVGAAGWLNYDRAAGTIVNPTASDVDEDVVFLDARVNYQLARSTQVHAVAGWAQTEDFFEASGQRDRDSHAMSLGVQTTF